MKQKELISTEELINVMKEEQPLSSDLKEKLLSSDNFLYFITFYNIKNGPDLISVMDLYNLYKHWSKTTYINLSEFKATTYKYLNKNNKTKKKGYYVSIDLDALLLSDKAKNILINNYEINSHFKSKHYTEEIKSFLNDMGIVSGKYLILLTTLYYIFRYWTDKSDYISIGMFEEYLKYSISYDKKIKLNKDTIFYIDKDALKFDGAILEKAKAFTEKNKKQNIKTKYQKIKTSLSKNKKKQRKIPNIKTVA